jgi:hypothetical protein
MASSPISLQRRPACWPSDRCGVTDLPLTDLSVIALFGAIYAFVIISFLVMMFFQFRLILQIWGVIWRAYGFKPWQLIRTRHPLERELSNWRTNPEAGILRRKFRKAGLVVIAAFILLFSAVLVVELSMPHVLDYPFMQL